MEEAGGGLVGAFAEAFAELPAGGGGFEVSGGFEYDEAVGGEGGFEEGEEGGGEAGDLVVGGVDEDEVVGGVGGAPLGGVGGVDGGVERLSHALGYDGDVLLDHEGGARVELDEGGGGGAAAEGFESVGAGAGEEVEDAGALDEGADAGEDALAELVHGGTVDGFLVDF